MANFLGSPNLCTVVDVHKSSTTSYKLKSKDGTFFPNARWEKQCTKDKKGEITSPWYITKLIKPEEI